MIKDNKKEILERIKAKKSQKTDLAELDKKDNNRDVKKKYTVPKMKDTYDTYVLWYSIPLAIKNLPKPELEKLNLSEIANELVTIRTKTQFSQKYNVSRQTLIDWEKNTKWSIVDDMMKTWLKMLTSNVRTALYKRIMRTGSAPEVKLFEQIVNDFAEKHVEESTSEIYVVAEDEKIRIKNLMQNAKRRRRN